MSEKLTALLEVKLVDLTDDQLKAHKDAVLTLDENEIVQYLEHVIDDEYDYVSESETDTNSQNVVSFLKDQDFKKFYDIILTDTDKDVATEQ
jgi:hypothetical protein